VQQNTQHLKSELRQLLEEKKRRQEIEFANCSGGVVVHNRDGSVKVVRIQFVEAVTLVTELAGLPHRGHRESVSAHRKFERI
jgi:hypothetical protein